MKAWRRVTAIGLVVLGIGATSAAIPATAAPSLPDDPAAARTHGLCTRSGRPVTSGSITDKPFVWRAVGSKAAPSPFDGKGASATLYAYQPRQGVPADQWSGDTLTASSSYTNKAHPMAQATQLDFTLQDYLNEYPPKQDGLVQLRLLVGANGVGAASVYASAFLRVSGPRWTMVAGSSGFSCTDGTARSSEVDAGIVDRSGNAVGTAAASLSASAAAASSAGARSGSAASSSTRGSDTSGPPPATPKPESSPRAAASPSSDSGTSAAPWVIVVAIVVVAALAALAIWRRRRGSGQAVD